MIYPKYLYRPDDLEAFVLKDDCYYLEKSLLQFPNNYHQAYSYDFLRSRGFLINKIKSKNREEHIAEFWKSFYLSIQRAGGNIESFHSKMTLQEVADVLAQNGIRFKND